MAGIFDLKETKRLQDLLKERDDLINRLTISLDSVERRRAISIVAGWMPIDHLRDCVKAQEEDAESVS